MAATTEREIAPFEIGKVRSPIVSRGKSQQSLVKAGNLGVSVQCVSNDSGETNLHAHPGMDSAWMVLNGTAKFYTVNDRVLGELGKNEVISIPAGAPYWFEAANEDPLVILHITSMDVIHSFAVHPLRITQDAIPGVSIPVHFVPTTVGDYQITCAQYGGEHRSAIARIGTKIAFAQIRGREQRRSAREVQQDVAAR